MFQILLTMSLGQCPNGACQVPPPQPIRQAVYATANTVAQAVKPTAERRQPLRALVRKVFGGKCR